MIRISGSELRSELRALHEARRARQAERLGRGRRTLTPIERDAVLSKSGRHCHICGGGIGADEAWQADHVVAQSAGGADAVENYLPAHAVCNNYRWDYSPEEFQIILKLGVWIRTHIERATRLGMGAAAAFEAYDSRRTRRRVRRP